MTPGGFHAERGRLALDEDGWHAWLWEGEAWHDLGPVSHAVVGPGDARDLQELEGIWRDVRDWDAKWEARSSYESTRGV